MSPTLSLARTVAWCLTNLLKAGGPGSGGERDSSVLKSLMSQGLGAALGLHLSVASDEALLGELCWIVCWIAQYGEEWVGALLQAGVVPFLLHQLREDGFASLLVPCIRTLAFVVVSCSRPFKHSLMTADALSLLPLFLSSTP